MEMPYFLVFFFSVLACACSSSSAPSKEDAGTTSSVITDGGSVCDSVSPCPKRAPATPQEDRVCRFELVGRCGEPYRLWMECTIQKVKCSDDGREDPTGIHPACDGVLQAFNTCKDDG